jgi:murein tripeptide amidase MpaA
MLCLCCLAHAELKYEQSLSLGNYVSHEEAKKMIGAFMLAAKGDPKILIKEVSYKQSGSADCIFYEGILSCYIAEQDYLMHISMKAAEIREQARLASIFEEIEDHMEKS